MKTIKKLLKIFLISGSSLVVFRSLFSLFKLKKFKRFLQTEDIPNLDEIQKIAESFSFSEANLQDNSLLKQKFDIGPKIPLSKASSRFEVLPSHQFRLIDRYKVGNFFSIYENKDAKNKMFNNMYIDDDENIRYRGVLRGVLHTQKPVKNQPKQIFIKHFDGFFENLNIDKSIKENTNLTLPYRNLFKFAIELKKELELDILYSIILNEFIHKKNGI